ncbi:hypothetical protein [Algoriphagus jejuensis]|uniref:hypothetical protein n=1 Tax=Algoriphagus jejuensis TaxID=419934 RepID=UPI0031CDB1E8
MVTFKKSFDAWFFPLFQTRFGRAFCGTGIASPLLQRAGTPIKIGNLNWIETEEKTAFGGPRFGQSLDWILKLLKSHTSSLRNKRAWGTREGMIKKIRKDTGF